MIDEMFTVTDPEMVSSGYSYVNQWEMRAGSRMYRVIATVPQGSDDTCFVMVDAPSDFSVAGGESQVHSWAKMRGSKTGGVITSEWIAQTFYLSPAAAERVAVLVASALGRPYAVRYSDDLLDTPD